MKEIVFHFFSSLSLWQYLLPIVWMYVVVYFIKRAKDPPGFLTDPEAVTFFILLVSTVSWFVATLLSVPVESQTPDEKEVWQWFYPTWIMAAVYVLLLLWSHLVIYLFKKTVQGVMWLYPRVKDTLGGKFQTFRSNWQRSDRMVLRQTIELSQRLLNLLPTTGFESERSRVLEIKDDLIPELLDRRHQLSGFIADTTHDLEHFIHVAEDDPRYAHRKRMADNLIHLQELHATVEAEIDACVDLLRTVATDFRILRHDDTQRGKVEALFEDLTRRTRASAEREREERNRAYREVDQRLPS